MRRILFFCLVHCYCCQANDVRSRHNRNERIKLQRSWKRSTSRYNEITRMGAMPSQPYYSVPTTTLHNGATIQSRRNALTAATTLLRAGTMTNGDTNHNINHNDSNRYHWTRQHLALIVPAWMGVLADPILRVIDTVLISRIGSTELAALGVCTSVFTIAYGIFLATTMATTSLVAAAASINRGQRHAKKIIIMSFQLALVVGMMLFVGLRWGGSYILARFLGVDATSELFQPALQYLHVRSFAAPAVLLLMVAEGAFRGSGDTRIPLLGSITAAMINLMLDPLLIFGLGYGVSGAAAATAVAQYGAVAVYAYFLMKRNMLSFPTTRQQLASQEQQQPRSQSPIKPLQTLYSILNANFSMLTKQGFTVFFYSYAAALATRVGSDHVAAHQVGLSIWLLFTFGLDAASVSGQVLMSQTSAEHNLAKTKSLIRYMATWAMSQGVVSMFGMFLVNQVLVPHAFSKDPMVQRHLVKLIPMFILPQVLVSLVLVLESMVVGGKQFHFIAVGTTLCTILAATRMRTATSVVSIWSQGFITLFLARLISALIGIWRVLSLQ